MEPDEIIQQKEWHELNAAERVALQELAENEHEYNLLKKMMQLSVSEAADVPMISSRVKENLLQHLPQTKTGSKHIYWYAAAAIAVLFIAGVLLFQKNKTPEIIASNNEKTTPSEVTRPVQIQPADSLRQATVSINKISSYSEHANNVGADSLKSNTQSKQQNTAYAGTTLSSDPELLNMITEIY